MSAFALTKAAIVVVETSCLHGEGGLSLFLYGKNVSQSRIMLSKPLSLAITFIYNNAGKCRAAQRVS